MNECSSTILSRLRYNMGKGSQNNELIRQNLALIENERREIAFELHNEIGQSLTAIRTAAQLMHRQSEGRQTHPVAKNIVALTDQMYDVMHRLLHRLHPSALDKFGLEGSLEDLLSVVQTNLKLDVTLEVEGDITVIEPDLQLAIYRIIQESLTNAVRHGQASQASVTISIDTKVLALIVTNNGLPLKDEMDALIQNKASGIGLLGIQHRVSGWLGEISFTNSDDGVTLNCTFPMDI
ncbi:MAG: histidine kinase [Ghiorsea sp.]